MVNSYVSIDLETTGLDAKRDKIVEIGAVRVEDGRNCAAFTTLVNPRRRLDSRICELTGISDAELSEAPDIGDVIREVLNFCKDLPLLGHHIIFDYSFLKRAAVNAGLEFEKDGLDTLTLCRGFMPAKEKKNLAAACAYYQVPDRGYHRALSDAHAANDLYRAMKDKHGNAAPEVFTAKSLEYRVKREQSATKRQKEYLRDLLKYHRISLTVEIDYLTRNEASRITDRIISRYGKYKRGE